MDQPQLVPVQMQQMNLGNTQCAIAQPPPKLCYCTPAPFAATGGITYFGMAYAYGKPRECQRQ